MPKVQGTKIGSSLVSIVIIIEELMIDTKMKKKAVLNIILALSAEDTAVVAEAIHRHHLLLIIIVTTAATRDVMVMLMPAMKKAQAMPRNRITPQPPKKRKRYISIMSEIRAKEARDIINKTAIADDDHALEDQDQGRAPGVEATKKEAHSLKKKNIKI